MKQYERATNTAAIFKTALKNIPRQAHTNNNAMFKEKFKRVKTVSKGQLDEEYIVRVLKGLR